MVVAERKTRNIDCNADATETSVDFVDIIILLQTIPGLMPSSIFERCLYCRKSSSAVHSRIRIAKSIGLYSAIHCRYIFASVSHLNEIENRRKLSDGLGTGKMHRNS